MNCLHSRQFHKMSWLIFSVKKKKKSKCCLLQRWLAILVHLYAKHSGLDFQQTIFEIFFLIFSQKTGFDIPYKLCPLETICRKCQIPFSSKNKEKYHQFVICWISPESGKGLTDIYTANVFALSIGTDLSKQWPPRTYTRKHSIWSESILFATYPAVFRQINR